MIRKSGLNPTRLFAIAVLISVVGACSQAVFWQNFAGTQYVQPQSLHTPSSAQELIDLVNTARNNNQRIRMTGSGHSYSDVAITRDVLLTPNNLNQVLSVDNSRLHTPNDGTLVRTQSGIPILTLSERLSEMGLALSNMGGHHAQTIIGAAMTATHGSGLNYGPISDQIVSLQVVDQHGNLLQIEPTNGISNPSAYPNTLEEDSNITVTLIQDDDTFNAFRVSVGSMGIVYAAIVQTEPKFWLREVRTKTTWEAFKEPNGFLQRLLAGQPLKDDGPDPDYYEVWFNPYPNGSGSHTLLLTERYKSTTPLTGDTQRGQDGADLGIELLVNLEKPVVWFLNNNPHLAPLAINATLDSQQDDDYVDLSYNIFTLGRVSAAEAFAIEVAVDLDQTEAAIERLLELAPVYQAAGMIHTTSVTARFVKQSDAWLAQTEGAPKMILEIVCLIGTHQVDRLFANYQEIFIEEFDARLHWGLDLGYFKDPDTPNRLYSRWSDWLTLFQQYNSTGVFDGKFTDRVGISTHPR